MVADLLCSAALPVQYRPQTRNQANLQVLCGLLSMSVGNHQLSNDCRAISIGYKISPQVLQIHWAGIHRLSHYCRPQASTYDMTQSMKSIPYLRGVAGRASGICIASWGAVAADRAAHVTPALQALTVEAVVAHLHIGPPSTINQPVTCLHHLRQCCSAQMTRALDLRLGHMSQMRPAFKLHHAIFTALARTK